MSDWRETEGDEWGPRLLIQDVDGVGFDGYVNQSGAFWCSGADPEIVRALLRAHDLRTRAPGTECTECGGAGLNNEAPPDDRPFYETCEVCEGTGRALTPAELERWKGWGK